MTNKNELISDFPPDIKTELDDYMVRIMDRILALDKVFMFKAEDHRVSAVLEPYKLISDFETKVLVGNFLRRLLGESEAEYLASCSFVGRGIINLVKTCEVYHDKPGRSLVRISEDNSTCKVVDEDDKIINSDQEVILFDVLASELKKVLKAPPVKIKEVVLFFGSNQEIRELQSVYASNIKLHCLFSMESILGEYLKRLN